MEVNFLNQKSCIPSSAGVFQFEIFFSVVLSESMCISSFGLSSSPLVLLLYCLSIQPFHFGGGGGGGVPYFSPKSLVCFRVISSQFLIEFSCVVLKCPVLSLLFYPLSITL